MEIASTSAQDTMRLTPQQVRSIFEALDRREAGGGDGKDRRKHERKSFSALKPVPFEVHEQGRPANKFLVIPRDLSASGISVLHGVFLSPGTRCTIVLTSANNGEIRVPGVVMRCQHIAGRVHEVGIKFEAAQDQSTQPVSGANWAAKSHSVEMDEKSARELIVILAQMLSEQAQVGSPGANLRSLMQEMNKEILKLAS